MGWLSPPLIPAKAGIQTLLLRLGPRFRGDERKELYRHPFAPPSVAGVNGPRLAATSAIHPAGEMRANETLSRVSFSLRKVSCTSITLASAMRPCGSAAPHSIRSMSAASFTFEYFVRI